MKTGFLPLRLDIQNSYGVYSTFAFRQGCISVHINMNLWRASKVEVINGRHILQKPWKNWEEKKKLQKWWCNSQMFFFYVFF